MPDSPDGDSTVDPGAPGYADAMAELETIVAELEGAAVDVDHLSARVQRAAELISVLRGRIGAARLEVSRVVVELDGTDD
jgi:exodeoxyribonuclease VII small subunit